MVKNLYTKLIGIIASDKQPQVRVRAVIEAFRKYIYGQFLDLGMQAIGMQDSTACFCAREVTCIGLAFSRPHQLAPLVIDP